MSGSPAKVVPEINLDEFEKRLRAAGAPSAGSEDPLAELTRLVNSVHADARRAARTAQSAPSEAEGEATMTLPPAFGAISDAEEEYPADAPPLEPAYAEPARARGSRGWAFKVTGMIVVGVVLLAGGVALKHGVPGLPKAPPFITADVAPTKVQPPNEANVQTTGDMAALLMKDSATPTPVKVINTEEQPVDLRTQTQPPAPTPSAAASPPNAVAPAPTLAVDASSPVATAPETQIVPPAVSSASVAPLFPTAKPVKTVSVRPDGTLITAADAAPPAAPPTVVPTPPAKVAVRAVDPVVATPEAATPKLDLPTKLSPKSQQRVIAKTDTTAPNADASATPSAPLQLVASPKPKPAKPAPKTVAEAAIADSPTAEAAPAAAAAAPVVTASAPVASAPAAAEGGGWAVQLAAPRSEADAHSAVAKLKSKYADELGDSLLSIHQADVKGQTIYRVRVSGLSRTDAGALCSKLKAGGGDCFIAKD
jgi:hypothetical protein